jgi:hypothetical protein
LQIGAVPLRTGKTSACNLPGTPPNLCRVVASFYNEIRKRKNFWDNGAREHLWYVHDGMNRNPTRQRGKQEFILPSLADASGYD